MLCVVAPPGDHEYVPPPVDGVAVRVAFCPPQIVCELTLTVAGVLTVTVPDPVEGHPPRVYVTVYVVVDAGEIVMLCVVAPPGDQE